MLRSALRSLSAAVLLTACAASSVSAGNSGCAVTVASGFSSAVDPDTLLKLLRALTGVAELEMAPMEASSPNNLVYSLPETVDYEDSTFVLGIEYVERPASVLSHHERSCVINLRSLPTTLGPGGSFRAVEFETVDARFSVKVAVFEDLKEGSELNAFNIESIAALIGNTYCDSVCQ
jgi:hypothetical protein